MDVQPQWAGQSWNLCMYVDTYIRFPMENIQHHSILYCPQWAGQSGNLCMYVDISGSLWRTYSVTLYYTAISTGPAALSRYSVNRAGVVVSCVNTDLLTVSVACHVTRVVV